MLIAALAARDLGWSPAGRLSDQRYRRDVATLLEGLAPLGPPLGSVIT